MIHIVDEAAGTAGELPGLAAEMRLAFSEQGLFSSSKNFEFRPQQQRMAELVADALEENRPLVVEAATGVGKSLAYLLPAVRHALNGGRKAVISTHTINLQEQLIHKDIPVLKKVAGEFKAVLLKGRGNYLCPTRLQRALGETGDLFTAHEAGDLQKILEWSKGTKDGTLSDLPFSPSNRVWSMVCSEAHACTPRRCGPQSGCWYQMARRQVAEADVVVMNHTLFFTLLSSSEENLPEDGNFLFPRDFVILDEAHTIENIAAKAFGIHVTESGLKFELSRLYNPRTRKGFFPFLGERQGAELVMAALDQTAAFFSDVEQRCKFGQFSREFRAREPGLVADTLGQDLLKIAGIADKAGDAAKRDTTKVEVHELASRLRRLSGAISLWLSQETDEEHVFWVEKSGFDVRSIALHSAPIDVSPRLGEIFFRPGKAAVFTSATLSVGSDRELGYFRGRVGARDCEAECIDSPFDFNRQMTLYVAKSMPPPGTPEYEKALPGRVLEFLKKSNGRAFVLFTSYGQMQSVADQLEDACESNSWKLLVQGRGLARHQMLGEFKEDVHSVLFGTDSFWTGVDVPGEALSNVIITRLPFAVPDHPVTASRMELIERAGGNAFSAFSVPEAILKLRQGVGRLIRSKRDRGICVILDNRIATKSYGRAFLASLPKCPVEMV
jgi:ATP-dependent DNA helicase DinG